MACRMMTPWWSLTSVIVLAGGPESVYSYASLLLPT